MSISSERGFRSVGGAAAGAGIAAAIAGIAAPLLAVPLLVPVIGGLLGLGALKLGGVLDDPDKPLLEASDMRDEVR